MFESIDSSFTLPTDIVKADVTFNLNDHAEKFLSEVVGWVAAPVIIAVLGNIVIRAGVAFFRSQNRGD